jgi:hypothetical protein
VVWQEKTIPSYTLSQVYIIIFIYIILYINLFIITLLKGGLIQMEFETIVETEKVEKSSELKVWTAELVEKTKTEIQERLNSEDASLKDFRIPMSYFMKGYTGKSSSPIIPAHNLVLRILGINYAKDISQREVVSKKKDGINVFLSKLAPKSAEVVETAETQ